MASCTLKQNNNPGVELLVTQTKGDGDAAVKAQVNLATSVADNKRMLHLYLDLTDNGLTQTATVTLTDAQLQQIYGSSAAQSSYKDVNLSVLAATFSDAAMSTQLSTTNTLLNNAGNAITAASYKSVPAAGVMQSVTSQDKYATIAMTVSVDEDNDLVKTNGKPTVSISAWTSGAAIQIFHQEAATSSVSGVGTGTLSYTLTARTPGSNLTNGTPYEISCRVRNESGFSASSNTLAVTPGNLPNPLSTLTVSTAYSSGTTLDTTNAAVLTAIFQDADAATADSTLVRFGAMSGSDFIAEQSATLAFTVTSNGDNSHTGVNGDAVGNMNVPLAWFANASNGGRGDVTSLEIYARVEQTTNGSTSNGPVVQFNTGGTGKVYKIVLPTISAISVSSVNGAGLQTLNLASGGTAVDSTPTVSSSYNGASANLPVTHNAGAGTFVLTNSFTFDYDTVDGGSNGDLTVTVLLPDANGTEQHGIVVSYTAGSTQALHAFKDAAAPTPAIVQPAVTAAPEVSVSAEGANNGYTFSSYTYVVKNASDQTIATYTGKTAAAFTANATDGAAYAIGNHSVTVTKILTGIPSFYDGTYTLSAPSATSGTVKYYLNPNITNVTFDGATMQVTLTTGGSNLTAEGSVTTIGFVGTASEYSVSEVRLAANAIAASENGSVTVNFVHPSALLTNINGGTFDAMVVADPSNAVSAFSLVTGQ